MNYEIGVDLYTQADFVKPSATGSGSGKHACDPGLDLVCYTH